MEPEKTRVTDYNFYKEISQTEKGVGISKCLSCGTCTSSCRVYSINPAYNPRKLIQKAVLGLKTQVLNDEMIWICSRCNDCIEKCPKGIRPGDIITAIRQLALENGITNNKGARHSTFFKKSILRSGKVNEMILPLYTLRFKIVSQIPQSARLLFKGKLPPLFPKKIKRWQELQKLNQLIEERRANK